MREEGMAGCLWFGAIVSVVAVVIVVLMWGLPQYNIYSQDMKGQANLSQQEREKQIMIEEAKAELESAKLKAEAELIRAKGMAESIAAED